MSTVKKVFGVVLAALVMVLIIMNVNSLTSPLKFSLLSFYEAQLPAGIWMVFTFLLGMVVSMILEAWRNIGRGKIVKNLNKEIKQITNKVEKYEKDNSVKIISEDDVSKSIEKG